MKLYIHVCIHIYIERDYTSNESGGGGLEPRTASVTVNTTLDVERSTSGQVCANKSRESTESKQHQKPSHVFNGEKKGTITNNIQSM